MTVEFDTEVFSSDFYRRLEHLKLLVKRHSREQKEGSLLASRPGGGQEFLGYSRYNPGDDSKYIDWHVYARIGELYTKKFIAERNKTFLLLIDASASMNYGTPAKFLLARRICAGISYVALHSGHMVQLAMVVGEMLHYSPRFSRPQNLGDILQFLSSQTARDRIDFTFVLRDISHIPRHTSLFLCSDFLDVEKQALRYIAAHGYDLSLIHVLAAEELNPLYRGDCTLFDSETQEQIVLELDEDLLRQYQIQLRLYREKWISFCRECQIRYFFVPHSAPIDKIIAESLYTMGWLQ